METVFFLNIPLQMISCTNTDGKIIPLKFKFRDKDGEIITVFIKSVSQVESNRMGATYTCTALFAGTEKNFVLHYNYFQHDWKLMRY